MGDGRVGLEIKRWKGDIWERSVVGGGLFWVEGWGKIEVGDGCCVLRLRVGLERKIDMIKRLK